MCANARECEMFVYHVHTRGILLVHKVTELRPCAVCYVLNTLLTAIKILLSIDLTELDSVVILCVCVCSTFQFLVYFPSVFFCVRLSLWQCNELYSCRWWRRRLQLQPKEFCVVDRFTVHIIIVHFPCFHRFIFISFVLSLNANMNYEPSSIMCTLCDDEDKLEKKKNIRSNNNKICWAITLIRLLPSSSNRSL